jgi:hypothetical protein
VITHTESVGRILAARRIEGDDYDSFEIDYTTPGGIRKTLRLAHGDADRLRVLVTGEIEDMPEERRKRSFLASLRRKR